MNKKHQLQFKTLSREGWENLALLALAVFYFVQFGMDLAWKNMCGQLAIDYCSFWSVGSIAKTEGYTDIYDLKKIEEIQRLVFPGTHEADGTFPTIPTPYLPVFMIPFQLLSSLGPYAGFWIWTLINVIVFIWYLCFFTQQTVHMRLKTRLLIMMLLSLPVFLNLFYGQVNFWLTIMIGEYIRAVSNNRFFCGGLWLAGLMIKPQFLIVIGLALILQRSIKILAGLAVGVVAIMVVSVLMAGPEGLLSLTWLLVGFTRGIPATGTVVMMNWRMIGLNMSPYLGSVFSWSLTGMGMAVTLVLSIYIWLRPINPSSPTYVLALLGTFAATNALAWHSHLYSATILIPPLIYLWHKPDYLPRNLIPVWVFVPPTFRFLVFILMILVQKGILSYSLNSIIYFLTAISLFALNIYILIWAEVRIHKSASPIVQ